MCTYIHTHTCTGNRALARPRISRFVADRQHRVVGDEHVIHHRPHPALPCPLCWRCCKLRFAAAVPAPAPAPATPAPAAFSRVGAAGNHRALLAHSRDVVLEHLFNQMMYICMNICIYTHTHACLSSRDVVLEHLFIQMMYVCMNIYVHTHTHMSVYQVVAWSSNTFDVCIMSCIYLYVHNMHHVMYISICT